MQIIIKRFSKLEFQATFRLYMQIWKTIINTDITRNVAVRREIWTTMKQKQTHIKDWSNGDWKHWTCNSFYDQNHVDKFYICLEKHYRTGSSQEIKVNQQWMIEIMHVLLKVTIDLLVINCKIPNFVIFSWHNI